MSQTWWPSDNIFTIQCLFNVYPKSIQCLNIFRFHMDIIGWPLPSQNSRASSRLFFRFTLEDPAVPGTASEVNSLNTPRFASAMTFGCFISRRIHVAGIYANIGGILMVNVTIYTIHGSYGFVNGFFRTGLCMLINYDPMGL